MSYIGRGIDQIDNISTLDNLSFNGSSTTFNLTQNGVAFVPVSADALQIQIDGIIQSGNYSTSGSTVTFNFTPSGSSVCNGIKHFGVGVAFTPSSGSVTKDKTNFVSTSSSAGLEIKGDGTTDGTLQLNCSQNSHGIKLKSPPHSASASYTLTFPNTDGNADQVLKTNGSGVLDWVDAGSGAMTLLNSTTASGLSAVNYDNFSATYDVYKLIGSCSTGVNNAEVRLQVRKSSSNVTSSNYRYAYISAERTSSASAHSSKGAWGAGSIQLTNGSSYSTSHPTSFDITIYAPFDGTRQTSMTIQSAYYRPNEDTWYSWSGGVWIDGDAGDNNTGISLFASSGTIDNAKMALYGVQKS